MKHSCTCDQRQVDDPGAIGEQEQSFQLLGASRLRRSTSRKFVFSTDRMWWRQASLFVCLTTCSLALGGDLNADGARRLRRADLQSLHHITADVFPLPKVELFIGVPSAHAGSRVAIRESWGRLATREHGVVLRFFASRDEDADTQEEDCYGFDSRDLTQCGDMVFIDGERMLGGHAGVAQKVNLLFQHAMMFFNAAYVMKADDDTFVNIPVVLSVLAAQASSGSAMYFGTSPKGPDLSEVEEGVPSSPQDTSERSALPIYAAGPAYVITGSAVRAMVAESTLMELHPDPQENSYVGVGLSDLEIQLIGQAEAGVDIIDSFEVGRDPGAVRFCPDTDELPVSWIHGVKNPTDMSHLYALAQSCMDEWQAAARTSPDSS